MLDYDAARAALRSAAATLSARRYAEAIAALDGESHVAANGDKHQQAPTGVPLALVGGPLLDEDFVLYDVAERAGGRIVLDATEGGERTMPAPFDRRRVRDDPLGELADAYFGAIPDVSRRPNGELFAWLKRELAARGVRGVILHRYLWCDLWEAETYRIKEWCAVPVLALSTGDGTADARARTTAHVAAFLEVLA